MKTASSITTRAVKPVSFSRRAVMGSLAAGALVASVPAGAHAVTTGNGRAQERRARARQVRLEAVRLEELFPLPDQPSNDDETRYLTRIGNYSKGLPHDQRGEVDPAAYDSLLHALATGDPHDFEQIQLGDGRPLINPQAGLAFELQGPDSHAVAMAPAPGFASARQAAEIAENYWMALARDVPFSEYGADRTAYRAAADLSRMQDFGGNGPSGRVSTATLFRGVASGDAIGPYVSQFLWQRTPFGAEEVDRRMRTALPGLDYMTSYPEWLSLQNGCDTAEDLLLDPVTRYIRNGRDLGSWVRHDVIFQAYFNAMLVLLEQGVASFSGNPYAQSRTQRGFGTFGEPHVASALCAVTTRALKAVWFQKWFVHRRLRPEAFGGRIHNHVTRAAAYPLHADILNSPVLSETFSRTGTYLLPMAYPEGAPQHPSYGAGHATVAGACVTILKAFFDEAGILDNAVEATPDGLALSPYAGAALTVGGELNKLASNIAFGRNFAGVHWRSDAVESMRLGEEVALRYLAEEKLCFNERFDGFSLTRFDGTRVKI